MYRYRSRSWESFVDWKLRRSSIVMFCKTYIPECNLCKRIINGYSEIIDEKQLDYVNLDHRGDIAQVETYLLKLSGKPTRQVPLLFINGSFVGGYEEITRMEMSGDLAVLIHEVSIPPAEPSKEDDQHHSHHSHHLDLSVRIGPMVDDEIIIKVHALAESHNPVNLLTQRRLVGQMRRASSFMSVLSDQTDPLLRLQSGVQQAFRPGQQGVGRTRGFTVNLLSEKINELLLHPSESSDSSDGGSQSSKSFKSFKSTE